MLFFRSARDRAVSPPQEMKGRIRGPRLSVLVEGAAGVAFRDAIKLVDERKLVIASNKRLDKALVGTRIGEHRIDLPCMQRTEIYQYLLPSDEYAAIKGGFDCWTGTMGAYVEPGRKLGKEMRYTDPETNQRYVFPVPQMYRDEKNSILIIEHPNYALVKDGGDLVVLAWRDADIILVREFPSENSHCLPEEEHGIPNGVEIAYYSRDYIKARLACRDAAGRIGPLFRHGGGGNCNISAYKSWDEKGGLIVEMPKGGFLDEAA